MKNVKNIAFVALLSLIMTSGIATMASSTHNCQGNACNDNTYIDTQTNNNQVYNTPTTYNNTTNNTSNNTTNSYDDSIHNTATGGTGGSGYSSAGSSSYSSGGTGVGYGGSSSAYNGGNSMDKSGNSTNIITTEGGAGGKATSDATAFGGNQQQGQLQGQVATGGNVKNSGNSDNTNKNSSTNSTTVNTGTTEVANKTITYKKDGYDLPQAAPAIAPVVVGQMGTTGVSGAVSTPFGGISGGFSKTNKEGKDLMKAQAEALRVQADAIEATTEGQVISQDIQNLKDADTLSDEDKAIVKEFILRKYRK